jgi:hypothetical protein
MYTNKKRIRHHGMRMISWASKGNQNNMYTPDLRPRCLLLFLKKSTIYGNPPSKSPSPFQIKPVLRIFLFLQSGSKQTTLQTVPSKQTTLFEEEEEQEEEEAISPWPVSCDHY